MADYIRRKQSEKKTATRHFAMKWSTSARVDCYLLEKQTRACSLHDLFDLTTGDDLHLTMFRCRLVALRITLHGLSI